MKTTATCKKALHVLGNVHLDTLMAIKVGFNFLVILTKKWPKFSTKLCFKKLNPGLDDNLVKCEGGGSWDGVKKVKCNGKSI